MPNFPWTPTLCQCPTHGPLPSISQVLAVELMPSARARLEVQEEAHACSVVRPRLAVYTDNELRIYRGLDDDDAGVGSVVMEQRCIGMGSARPQMVLEHAAVSAVSSAVSQAQFKSKL